MIRPDFEFGFNSAQSTQRLVEQSIGLFNGQVRGNGFSLQLMLSVYRQLTVFSFWVYTAVSNQSGLVEL